jgi:hypothetical protein
MRVCHPPGHRLVRRLPGGGKRLTARRSQKKSAARDWRIGLDQAINPEEPNRGRIITRKDGWMAQTGEILERQRGLKARLAELEAELLEHARGLGWFVPTLETVRDERRRLW